jgi:hypothetical protein
MGHEHNLSRDSSLAEQLLCLFCLDKRKPLSDQRPDLVLLKEIEESD